MRILGDNEPTGTAGEQEIAIAVSDEDFEFCIDDLSVPVICLDAED
jgi:hypothetical protein